MLRWLEESQLQPGRSEAELAWAIEKYFRDNGASELAFPSIVAVDQNAALPHAIPGEKKLPDNGLVLVDVGCRVDGYCSDQTRTFWVGDAPHKEFRETMKLVRDAQQAALDKMRPGLPLHEAYTLARACSRRRAWKPGSPMAWATAWGWRRTRPPAWAVAATRSCRKAWWSRWSPASTIRNGAASAGNTRCSSRPTATASSREAPCP